MQGSQLLFCNFPFQIEKCAHRWKITNLPKGISWISGNNVWEERRVRKKLFNVGKKKGLKHSREGRNVLYSKM